ncbi:site-2 protease family protein [Microcystis sp. LEGE 00066]|nr:MULTISPECIES: site-2 protease family protein [Microcystis]MBE9263667.1 site-2 protease family protein [Microcystis sp. LEGE 00066]TRU06931.1 MAG: CBS domain-containing protein [Microcystis aeruginosa Ma_AC_P_19900807_S300]UGS09538.1 site-2 protease family protein [Microcystis aeruginosa FACHB-905 = DIANCHI905]WKX60576.1 site-2 protease family protein [Microcystis aeruginosa PCC 7806]
MPGRFSFLLQLLTEVNGAIDNLIFLALVPHNWRRYKMNGNIRVGNLFGIPFYINPSWFFVLGLITLTYGGELSQFPQLTGIMPWLLGFLAAILLFASVVAHELGHSFVAIAQGIEVKSITLFLFGGLATLGRESKTPLEAFLVAIAGPLVSLLLFGIFLIIGLNISLNAPLAAILSLLAYINLALGLFNLIPGLPLDGGNILKAIVWQVTGNPNKGVLFASRFGQFFGWLAIVIGALSILGISQLGSFWTLLIGIFLLQNAGFSAQSAKVQDFLSRYSAKDVISPNSPVVPINLTLREFANNYVIGKQQWSKFLVTDSEGKLLGVINVEDLKTIPTSQWTEVNIGQLLQTSESLKLVLSHTSLLDVVKILEGENLSQVTVVEENGTVLGLIEKASILTFLAQETQSQPA